MPINPSTIKATPVFLILPRAPDPVHDLIANALQARDELLDGGGREHPTRTGGRARGPVAEHARRVGTAAAANVVGRRRGPSQWGGGFGVGAGG